MDVEPLGDLDHAHRDELRRLVDALPGATLHRWYEETGDCSCLPAPNVGQVDLTGIDLPDPLVAYLCGPLPFMRAVRTELLRRGVPASDIHYEVFGPDLWLGQNRSETGRTGTGRLSHSGRPPGHSR